jgi:protein-disulfide isomerase
MSPHHPFTLTVPVGPADHLLGSAHAPVQVVEYGDFECPHCRRRSRP